MVLNHLDKLIFVALVNWDFSFQERQTFDLKCSDLIDKGGSMTDPRGRH